MHMRRVPCAVCRVPGVAPLPIDMPNRGICGACHPSKHYLCTWMESCCTVTTCVWLHLVLLCPPSLPCYSAGVFSQSFRTARSDLLPTLCLAAATIWRTCRPLSSTVQCFPLSVVKFLPRAHCNAFLPRVQCITMFFQVNALLTEPSGSLPSMHSVAILSLTRGTIYSTFRIDAISFIPIQDVDTFDSRSCIVLFVLPCRICRGLCAADTPH